MPDQQQNGTPKPCVAVDLAGGVGEGYAVLKDRVGATQFLLMPTRRIPGIESPELLSPDVPNYFADAWQARRFVDERAHRPLPRDDISLVINSAYGRSQNQLHIHIDCVRADVRDALRERAADIRDEWSTLDVKLNGHTYLVRRLVSSDLASVNPFQLLADGVPQAARDMGAETLVAVGAVFSDGLNGFYLLSDHADGATGDRGSGEELQDHSCAVAATAR